MTTEPNGTNFRFGTLDSRFPKFPQHTLLFPNFVAIHPRNPVGDIHVGDKCRQGVGIFDNFGLVPTLVQYKRLNLRRLMELARHLQGDGCSTNTENNERWTC